MKYDKLDGKEFISPKHTIDKKGYELHVIWKNEKDAIEQCRLIRHSYYGIIKKPVYRGVKILPHQYGWSVWSKPTKKYLTYLRTGIDPDYSRVSR